MKKVNVNGERDLPLFPLWSIVFLVLLELLAFFAKGSAARFAGVFWLLQWLVIAFFILKIWIGTMATDIKMKEYHWPIFQAASILAMILVLGNLSLTDLNYDADQQIVAGLNGFSSFDFSYFSTGFLGYGVRQYLINAIPSYLFGRSTFLLHLGFALPFLIGYMTLSVGFKLLSDKIGGNALFAILPMALLLSIPSVLEVYLVFEQTISPLSAAMSLLGLLIIFALKRDFIYFFGVVWFGGLLCFSYTPSLVFVGFSLALSLFIIFGAKDKVSGESASLLVGNHKYYAWANMLYVGVFLLLSWLTRQDRPNGMAENLQLNDVLHALWMASFGTNYGFGVLGAYGLFGLLTAPILFICVWSFLNFRERPYLALAGLFVVLTPVAAVVLRGYTSYELGLSAIRRSLVVIPLAVLLIYFAAIRWKDHVGKVALPLICS